MKVLTNSAIILLDAWNAIGISVNSSHFTLMAIPRFGTKMFQHFVAQGFISSTDISIGGNLQGSSVQNSLSGIINKMWYTSSYSSESTFETAYAHPSKYCLSNDL